MQKKYNQQLKIQMKITLKYTKLQAKDPSSRPILADPESAIRSLSHLLESLLKPIVPN